MFKFIVKKIKGFCCLPFSRKIQYLRVVYFKIKGVVIYRYLFKKFGRGSVVSSPLFMSYEAIEIGERVLISWHARIETISNYANEKFTPSIILGDGVTIEQRCHITAASKLVIGANSLISYDVMIQDTDHNYQNVELPVNQQPISVSQTTIGENCFIGSGAKINAGTTLGTHCIVGAGAVVRGSFPDYSVIVGIPGKIIKRFNAETQSWDKTDDKGRFLAKNYNDI